MNYKFFILCLLALPFLTSCEKQSEKDREKILNYIEDNNLNAQEGEDGLFYVIEVEGTGDTASIADDVKVHYEGFLLNGDKFDSSIDRGTPATFPLANVIKGWQLGIPKFKEGGSGKLLIPSALGYGATGTSSIPANSVLIFDVEVIEVL
ncbi:FKBP-type peptidyl-prolyl cis-trans isomerase [Saprospira grandis]|uniref:FKBP-type peptidyl-prolyl cis-trans isomerase n=1 Tax=Saprospira grandis TaxID=1008 RepID=UPI0022DD9677|nr:FKBP-type peptidyl-prolyl cis-trans isomerase [Saprospira grandis]WBM73344.1 FKBP-type peptidyl-prolyl cis-trans isomerase [Saprospira grandis]